MSDDDHDGERLLVETGVRPVYPAPSAPLEVAHQLYKQFRDDDGTNTLVSWRGGWMRWYGPHWAELDSAELRSGIYKTLGEVDYQRPIMKKV